MSGRVYLFSSPGAEVNIARNVDVRAPLSDLVSQASEFSSGDKVLIVFGEDEVVDASSVFDQIATIRDKVFDDPLQVCGGTLNSEGVFRKAEPNAPVRLAGSRFRHMVNFEHLVRPMFQFAGRVHGARFEGFSVSGYSAQGFLRIKRHGEGRSIVEDLSLKDFTARNMGRLLNCAKNTTVRNFRMSNVSVVGLLRGIARFDELINGVFDTIRVDTLNVDGGRGANTAVIAIQKGNNIRFTNMDFKGTVNYRPKKTGKSKVYVQGDGVVLEKDVRDVTIENCRFELFGDGGCDVKASNVTIQDCVFSQCKYGVRIWSFSDNLIRNSVFEAPVGWNENRAACAQVKGNAVFENCAFFGRQPYNIIDSNGEPTDAPRRVTIAGGQIDYPDGPLAKVIGGSAPATLVLKDVKMNGETVSKTINHRP